MCHEMGLHAYVGLLSVGDGCGDCLVVTVLFCRGCGGDSLRKTCDVGLS